MSMTTPSFSRRRFLVSAATASLGAPWLLRAGARTVPPNAKLHHACVGVGGMGWNDLNNFLTHPRVEVVALCDVDSDLLAKAAALVPQARIYADWRELLDKEGDKLDSVNAAVPDHTHFAIAYSAIQRRKHVYCQKPLCHDAAEIRALVGRPGHEAPGDGVVRGLDKGEAENFGILEHFAEFFVLHFCERREHHEDEADCNRDRGGSR